MEVVHTTGATAKKKAKKEQALKERIATMKHKRKIRWLLLIVAIVLSSILFAFNCHWYVYTIPVLLHFLLGSFYFAIEFYTKRNEARAWQAYLIKYQVSDGKGGFKIPEHIKKHHQSLIQQGKKIPM